MATVSAENLQQLIALKKKEKDLRALKTIENLFKSAEAYHQAIIEMEAWMKLYDYQVLDREEYQTKRMELDRTRTSKHNVMLIQINAVNRMAAHAGIGPVYDGTVSEESPYRRQAADAMLALLESLILARP